MLLTVTNKLEGTGEISAFLAEVTLTSHRKSMIKIKTPELIIMI